MTNISSPRPSSDGDQLQTPVAFFIYKRPEQTALVFETIRAARPTRLFLIADGACADRPGEAEKVRAARAVVADIEWPCTVLKNFSDENLGCKHRMSSGLSWVFGQVPEAIILEDDCLPSPAFFRFCEEMLAEYRTDHRIFSISGSNFGVETLDGHYLSDYSPVWGWASWSDRWSHYVLNPNDISRVLLAKWGTRPSRLVYWSKVFSRRVESDFDTWDYQWILTTWRHAALAVRPRVNLVRNIGFGSDATHTTHAQSPLAAMIAHNPKGSFLGRHGPFLTTRKQDAVDEHCWEVISLRSIVVLYFPWLSRVKEWMRTKGLAAGVVSSPKG